MEYKQGNQIDKENIKSEKFYFIKAGRLDSSKPIRVYITEKNKSGIRYTYPIISGQRGSLDYELPMNEIEEVYNANQQGGKRKTRRSRKSRKTRKSRR
jgi:hypothetical protein